jgi:hypothetical protein
MPQSYKLTIQMQRTVERWLVETQRNLAAADLGRYTKSIYDCYTSGPPTPEGAATRTKPASAGCWGSFF